MELTGGVADVRLELGEEVYDFVGHGGIEAVELAVSGFDVD